MKLKLTFHEDPGHGWLEVPVNLLVALGIYEHISPYSYIDKSWGPAGDKLAFLEEDLDYGTFMKAAKAAGREVTVTEVYEENTPIRHYPGYPSHPNWEALSGYRSAA